MAYETPSELEDKYKDLKNEILEFAESFSKEESEKIIESLKRAFSVRINSVRRLDAASSVRELIRLLEKRHELGWFNVTPFLDIIKEYEMKSTRQTYFEYLDQLEQYMLKNKQAFTTQPFYPDALRRIPKNTEVIPRHISEHICNEMKENDSWIKFGQELIKSDLLVEGQLDQLIEDRNMTGEEKTQRLLDIFVKGDKRTKWSQLSRLLNSVDHGLGEEVHDMFIASARTTSSSNAL